MPSFAARYICSFTFYGLTVDEYVSNSFAIVSCPPIHNLALFLPSYSTANVDINFANSHPPSLGK